MTNFKNQLQIRCIALLEKGLLVSVGIGTFLDIEKNYSSIRFGWKYLIVVFLIVLPCQLAVPQLFLISGNFYFLVSNYCAESLNLLDVFNFWDSLVELSLQYGELIFVIIFNFDFPLLQTLIYKFITVYPLIIWIKFVKMAFLNLVDFLLVLLFELVDWNFELFDDFLFLLLVLWLSFYVDFFLAENGHLKLHNFSIFGLDLVVEFLLFFFDKIDLIF